MPAITHDYLAQRFRPRANAGQELLLFVAPAADIRRWAGVPRKAFDYQHGFQRTLQPVRVSEVADFFLEDPKNVTPTAVVVGFTSAVELIAEESPTASQAGVDMVRVRITMPDLGSMALEELVDRALDVLRKRLPSAVVDWIERDTGGAVQEALKLEGEEAVDEAFGIVGETVVNGGILEVQERSYLADFFAKLLGYRKHLIEWPDEQQLREILYSLLKPAMIVDGQHRVFGAATVDESMLLAVCAMPNATWADNVFQFVVINQKAKPIKPAFLSSIIATSLSYDEIGAVYSRLGASNIDVESAQQMERINVDTESPFRGMIDFGVEGAPGFLQFPGMLKLERDFANIPRSHPILLPNGVWEDATDDWMRHFFALWRGVRSYFEGSDPRLWQRSSDDNPNNLLKIVTLQEVQGLMLDTWADSRAIRLSDPAQTEEQARVFWEGFPATFFTDEWRKKGLQTSVGRRIIRDAITETRRNAGRKNWGHRRLGLFSD